MSSEPYYSRHGDELYRLHRKAGVGLVADEWVAGTWQGMSDLDYVIYRTMPITAAAAANLIARRGRPGSRISEDL
ncbi:MAG TPA: hypothetical protein VK610_05480 [Rhodothermales bacterium]|nr:hypothetical protein [Rhodothermales bacterium]